MAAKLQVGFIGGGNMGAAIIGGIYQDHDISVVELNTKRANYLCREYKVTISSLEDLCQQTKIIFLAVKPQNFDAVLADLAPCIRKNHLIVSIAAGITTLYIEKRLPAGTRVVRTMPNLPAQVGHGVTGISAGSTATPTDLNKIKRLFRSVGQAHIVEEKFLDAVTAISGSGPAYVYLFLESWIKASRKLGIEDAASKDMVVATCRGALELLDESGEDASVLREKVTSKGGTTAAALECFQSAGFEKIFYQAIKAAQKRAKELSR